MKYGHIVFDIDGTMLDSEYADLNALQRVIRELQNREIDLCDLRFALGIPGETALKRLGVEDTLAANKLWNSYMNELSHMTGLFDGIRELISGLKERGVKLGIITSKNRTEYNNDFMPTGLNSFFETVICVDDSIAPKPTPEPMFAYLRKTGADPHDVLYIGDTVYDRECAYDAGVDFGLALWGCRSPMNIYATRYFKKPEDILYWFDQIDTPSDEMPWLKWAIELQYIAQAGITYCKDNYDLERFHRIREISSEIMSLKSDLSTDVVNGLFCNEEGFQTPKLDTRAAIFENGKILLVKENNGTWSLPGGWIDVNQSIKTNTVKEVKEESGLDVIPVKLIALQDRNLHNLPVYAYGVCKAFVLCEIVGGKFCANTETLESRFFSQDELPLLAEEKNNARQIRLCFEAYADDSWETVFD